MTCTIFPLIIILLIQLDITDIDKYLMKKYDIQNC